MTYRPYSTIPTSSIKTETLKNTSGITITKATPVRVSNTGELDFVNPSIENEVLNIIGVAGNDINNNQFGPVIGSGRIENVTITGSFGDIVYLSKTGGLTNIKPDIGVNGFVAGDFVVMIGVIAKNPNNPAQKDLFVNIDIVGQL